MGDLSANFSRREFVSGDGREADPSPLLVQALERLRARKGNRPLRIVSGYRSPEHNRRVGGAPSSQHLYNRAADIPYGYATVADAAACGFSGIGSRNGFAVHVDVRPGGPARWRY